MNPMTNVKNIKKLSEEELKGRNKTSWHEQYRGSAWIFVGGLPYDLTEGDIICVFSQYGEPLNVNLVRDKESGKSKGFCFICYEDQRSTDLAVDNLNGIKILGRTLRVDHVEKYKPPKSIKDEQLAPSSNIKKEKLQRERINHGHDFLADKIVENDGKLNKRKTKHTETCKPENDHKGSHNKKKRHLKVKRKRKKQDACLDGELESEPRMKIKRKTKSSGSESSSSTSLSSSPSSSSPSSSSQSPTSSSSSSSSSTSSSSSCDEGEEVNKKNKKTNNEKYKKQKRNRTIEDLKREARLIQAELKRRQQMDEQTKKSRRALGEKQESRRDDKESRFRSGEKDNRRENSKDRHRNFETRHRRTDSRREDRRDRSVSVSRDRRRSRSPERIRENGEKRRYR